MYYKRRSRTQGETMSERYTLKTVSDIPYGTYPAYPEGPALVAHTEWHVSTSTVNGATEATAGAFRVISQNPYKNERHELDGQTFPTSDLARQAQYNAGLLAYMVYNDNPWAKLTRVVQLETELNQLHALPSLTEAQDEQEQNLWDSYSDLKDDLGLCLQLGCRREVTFEAYCPEHRARERQV
jgi:hypothetical protein